MSTESANTAADVSATATPESEGSASQNLLEALKEAHRHIERLRQLGDLRDDQTLRRAMSYAEQLRAQILALNSHPWSQ